MDDAFAHKNVNLCASGALGLYLLARFHQTSEADGIQFKNNKRWFSIKLLIDSHGRDNTKAASDQAYYSSMKDACKNLQRAWCFGNASCPIG